MTNFQKVRQIYGADWQKVGKIYRGPAIQGLWNYETNPPPKVCSIKTVVCSVNLALQARGIFKPLQLHSMGNSKIPESIKGRRELDYFVDSFITSSSLKKAAEFRVKFMMRSWSRTHAPGDYLVLLASGKGYEEEAMLLEEKGQHLLLFEKESTNENLRKHSHIFWVWEQLLRAHETDPSYKKDMMGTTKEEREDC